MSKQSPRPIDHIVLPVENMKIALERYTRLGFTVAPEGRHSFGTENCCVYFANGSFIEPLAIGHRETVEENELAGNMFLRRDLGYRFRNDIPGFSALALTGSDAMQELQFFRESGYRTGEMVLVERPGVKAHLAFALDERSPDCTFFTCQSLQDKVQFEASLTTHENGALRVSRVVAVEENPSDFQYYAQVATGQREVVSNSFGIELGMQNGELAVLTPVGLEMQYGFKPGFGKRGLRLIAFDIEVADMEKTRDFLDSYQISYTKIGSRMVVQPAAGLGAALGFIEKED